MHIDKEKTAENLHSFIRKEKLRTKPIALDDLASFQHVISVLDLGPNPWDKLDTYLLKISPTYISHDGVTFWAYGIFLRAWVLFHDGPLALQDNYNIRDIITTFLYYTNTDWRESVTVHALPGRIHANKQLRGAVDEGDAGKIKMLVDLTPNPTKNMRNVYGYILNHRRPEFFHDLFQQFGTEEDIEQMKKPLLQYWLEIVFAREINSFFGQRPFGKPCWEFFWRLAENDLETCAVIEEKIAKDPLVSEGFVQDAIRHGVLEDVALIPDEPSLAWLTYRRRAQLLAEYAADFRAVLTPSEQPWTSIELAEKFVKQE